MANTFTSTLTRSVGTSAMSVYTVPALTTSTILGLNLANTTLISTLVDIFVVRGSDNFYLLKGGEVPVGGALVAVGGEQKHVLIAGDDLRVQANQVASIDVILSLMVST